MKNVQTVMGILLLSAVALCAQGPTGAAAAVVRHPNVPLAATPVVGYVLQDGATEIYPILGTVGRTRLGGRIMTPPGATRLYLPPRQQYALVETSSDQPMSLWKLLQTVTIGLEPQSIPIAGSMPHADIVVFSPRGESLGLYSRENGRLQLIGDLLGKPSAIRDLSLSGFGDVTQFALSDDGLVVTAAFSDGRLMFSAAGAPWQAISNQYSPAAWSFVPNTHDLVISDPVQSVIALFRGAHGSPQPLSAQRLRADQLSFTKDGTQLLAGSSSEGSLWSIQIPSGAVTALAAAGKVQTVLLLRDGITFLLSSSPSLSLVKLSPQGGAVAGPGQSVSLTLLP